MKFVFSNHFSERNKLRNISMGIATAIFSNADGHYMDAQTNAFVAVKRIEFQGRERNVGLTYVIRGDEAVFITIHPLKEGQKQNRINNGRWKPL